jgi:hypothetical protein
MEELARGMQTREQKALLHRLIFAVVCAVPTFVLGVVYMMLVPKENEVRSYLMEPMLVGNVSRIQWALWFLATPVMFYSAGIYHKRSFKEIGFLWRRGSTTPLLQRFTRFGSMNLLVNRVRCFRLAQTLIKGSLVGIHWGFGCVFCVHRVAGSRGGTASISRTHGGLYYLFRFCRLFDHVFAHR